MVKNAMKSSLLQALGLVTQASEQVSENRVLTGYKALIRFPRERTHLAGISPPYEVTSLTVLHSHIRHSQF